MTGPARDILLTNDPLTAPAPRFSPVAGGIVDFYGVVRGQENAAPISGINYEAHADMARHQLSLLADEAFAKFPLLGLTLHHRVGFVAAAEASLFLRVSAAHRGPAFEAAQWLIEQLKLRVPIWKHPAPAKERPLAETSPDSVA